MRNKKKRIKKESLSAISFRHSLPSPSDNIKIVNWQICVYKKILRKFNFVLFCGVSLCNSDGALPNCFKNQTYKRDSFIPFRDERFFFFTFESYMLKKKVCLYFLWANIKDFFFLSFSKVSSQKFWN